MAVTVRIHPFLRNLTGGQEIVEVQGKTVGECLDDLEAKFPGIKRQICDPEGKLVDPWEIYVNSTSSHPEGLAKPVQAGDELAIMALILGG
jgi:molybdopterin synthase sulfur carrier subunit